MLSRDEIAILLSAAGAAPSMHNTQPWIITIDGVAVDVRLDPDRTLPAEDPTGRWMRIGLGAAALNLRVAAAVLGHSATVVIDPDPARADIVARLFLGGRGSGDRDLAGLYPQIHRRRTHRGPMSRTGVDARIRDLLDAAARSEHARLIGLGAGRLEQFLGLVVEAEVLDNADAARRDERATWIGADRDRDGVPTASLGPRPDRFPAAYRDLGTGLAGPARDSVPFESAPVLLVLTTPDEGPDAWVRAGMVQLHGK